MRQFGKALGRLILLLAVLALAAGLWKREELARLLVVNTLFEPDRIVAHFSNMDRAFLHTPLTNAGARASLLPQGIPMDLPTGMTSWMLERSVTSLVVLKDGALVHEGYYLGTQPHDLRIGWSLSKSFISALTGIVVAEGAIASLDDLVTTYAPALKGTAYDGSTLRNVLNMSTGVTFDEDYMDFHSDINRMGRVLALGGLMDDFAASLTDTFTAPGTDWKYVSIDTHVLGMVLRGATGQSITDLMRDKIIDPLRLERAPYYLTDGAGVAFVLGGLNMTTRDYARFGQMIAQHGVWQEQRIVPADWVVTSTTASAPTDPDQYGYGFQWWIPTDARPREYLGRGIYGQYLYINEPQGVVIALTAADPAFRDATIQREHIAYFRAIAGQP
ncbi:MAG: serine hydrolase domain-containing protein [Roseobacter sp.]